MKTRKQLLKSPEYWLAGLQMDIFRHVSNYLKANPGKDHAICQQAGISTRMLKIILNGDYNGKLSELCAIAIATGYAPKLQFKDLKECN